MGPPLAAAQAWSKPTWLATGLVVLLVLVLPWIASALGSPALIGSATRIVIYAIAAMSLNLILGYGGLVSFGHAAFFGIGGYVVGILFFHLREQTPLLGLIPGTEQLLVTVPLAMLVGGLAALAIGALALKTSGIPFIMITLAFAQMIYFLFVGLKTYGGDDGLIIRRRNELPFLNTRDDTTFYFICLVCLALYLLACWRIVHSRFGRILSGTRQNERRMVALGISPYPYRLVAFVIAGVGAALSGALMANFARFVSPDMMHWIKSGDLIIMVVLGGTGTLLGPILGAGTLIALEEVLSARTENWQLFLGIILLAIVLMARHGLNSLFTGRRKGGGRD